MRSRSWAELRDRALALLPATATAIAEGAWIAVVYAAIAVIAGHDGPHVDWWAFAVAAAAGIVAVRRLRDPGARAAVAGLSILAAVAGWVADPAVWRALSAGAPGEAATTHIAGVILGAAVWRGSTHGDPRTDDLVVGRLLSVAVPVLAVPWLLGAASRAREAFISFALPATLLFVAAGLVAVGLTRLDALGRTVGVDWRRNRTWIALLVGVVAVVTAIGVPLAALLGASADTVVAVLLGPVRALGTAAGTVLGAAAGAAAPLVPAPGPLPVPLPPLPAPSPAVDALAELLGSVAGLVVLAAVPLLGLVAWWRGRGAPRPPEVGPTPAEERRITLPRVALRLPALRPGLSLSLPRTPRTASGAYLALLRDLGRIPARARRPSESPSAHARRLREAGTGSLPIDLLAADFELERYAAVRLPPSEVRRAIRRWRIARRGS